MGWTCVGHAMQLGWACVRHELRMHCACARHPLCVRWWLDKCVATLWTRIGGMCLDTHWTCSIHALEMI